MIMIHIFQNNVYKLCLCDCENCTKISPHPVHNCFYKCKRDWSWMSQLSRNWDLMPIATVNAVIALAVRKKVLWIHLVPGHKRRDCFDFCKSSTFYKMS
jgi:hypothetical protein